MLLVLEQALNGDRNSLTGKKPLEDVNKGVLKMYSENSLSHLHG